MLKRDEVSDPNSCLNKAKDDEIIFVLLGRDVATPVAIRAWVEARIEAYKNLPTDPQIVDALRIADDLERQYNFSATQA